MAVFLDLSVVRLTILAVFYGPTIACLLFKGAVPGAACSKL